MASGAAASADVGASSSAYLAMEADWRTIEAILTGIDAIRAAGETYLPKFNAETDEGYKRRLASAPWRPEFADALAALSAKPFGKEVAVQGETSERLRAFCEDVDTLGNNLHVFARETFERGVAFGFDAIFVDHQPMREGATRAEEQAAGARPYWIHVRAQDILALYTELRRGKTIVSHVRFREVSVERDGYTEVTVTRVRVLEPGRWEIWKQTDKGFEKEDEGTFANVAEVPFVLFAPGQRDGSRIRPPLRHLAALQIELYRALSRLEEILTFVGFPMLCANGMMPPTETDPATGKQVSAPIAIGPGVVLFAPPSGDAGGTPSWTFVQPDPDNLKEAAAHVRTIIEDMRRLGLQPAVQRSGTITATATATETAKAHSVVESWASALKDALERALEFTAQFYREEPTAEVFVHTDFGVDIDGTTDMAELLKARVAGEIARETYWDELRRRGKLGPQFDPLREAELLDEESVGRGAVVKDA
ncbi:DUF4055 domain-containing protein [Methylobacterium hispanicum]|uniref:DUF4055 domain-containing protein n=1 Tax=Methylobacterium hispanicum TaxID=270350 RepID=UPI002F2F7F4D